MLSSFRRCSSRTVLSMEDRRTIPCTSQPFSRSNSARYEPSCPVIPVMSAFFTKRSLWKVLPCGLPGCVAVQVRGEQAQSVYGEAHVAIGSIAALPVVHEGHRQGGVDDGKQRVCCHHGADVADERC